MSKPEAKYLKCAGLGSALGLHVQITIQSIDLKDFVDIAVHIDKSDAVAIVDTRIIADLGLDGPDGIVVDSGKRVYIGETEIQAPGFSIWAGTSTSMYLPFTPPLPTGE